MAELKARFSLIDEMSEKLGNIADKGQSVIEKWEQAGSSASSAIDDVSSAATKTTSSISGVVSSIDDLNSTISSTGTATGDLSSSANDAASAIDNLSESNESTGSSADELSSKLDSLGNSIESAASDTDNWTKAAGSYNKSALEMVYSTEELVELGYKTSDALYTESETFMECEKSIDELNNSIEASKTSHDEFVDSITSITDSMDELSKKSEITSESQKELEKAEAEVTQALKELEAAQNEAQQALAEWDKLVADGSVHIKDYENAANNATEAVRKLEEAQNKASSATKDYSDAAQKASESAEESGNKGVDAVTAIAETLIAKKIAEKVEEIVKACYELTDAFSDGQEIIVNATGATGGQLDKLNSSMMHVYADHNRDINTVAGGIGEINTRLGLTGDRLEEVTGLFIDYARITNTDVVSSVQNVTKVMNQWGVEEENVESLLDRLAYAGQISGISVDKLSQTLITGAATFQEVGLSLDSTIQLLADFELAGINSSVAISGLRTAVNNFSKEGLDSEQALQEVINQIANMENAADATALAVDTFGRQAGQQLAASIRNGTVSIDSFNATLEEADGTLKKTAEAGETLGEKWDKSSNKIKSAFTKALQPTLDKVSSKLAGIAGFAGDFLNKHPAITKGIVAIGAGLTVAATAIAGVTFAVTVAIPAINAFGASIQAALGPIGWISLGATALVGGIMALTSAFDKSKDEVEDYNGTMTECQEEIQRTESAYEKACDLYGENSYAAKELADSLDTLNKQYDKGGGLAAAYSEQASKLSDSLHEVKTAQQDAIEQLEKSQTSGLTAIAALSALSEQSGHTNKDLDLMASYADYLNDTFNCDIKVNYDTGELINFDPQEVTNQVVAAANEERYKTAMAYLSGAEFVDKYVEASTMVAKLTEEYNRLSQAEADAQLIDGPYSSEEARQITDDLIATGEALKQYEPILAECEAEIEKYGNIIDSTGEFTKKYKETLAQTGEITSDLTGKTEELTQQELEWNEAAAYAYNSVIDDINELCTAYNEAYDAAYKSLTGQFGLFDQASTQSEAYLNATVSNAQSALDSQLAYWDAYSANIERLKQESATSLGISQENYDLLMSYVQSGDEQAAGLAQSIVNSLDTGNKEAVSKLAETAGAVQSKQEEIANSVAEWQTDFYSKMDDILKKANETIDGLNLSSEASSAAKGTMDGYIAQLKLSGQEAINQAQFIAKWVSSALSSANAKINVSLSTSSVQHNATGTTNADDVFIAGEEGPELVVGKGGSTVFPTSETNKIISALDNIGGESRGSVTDNSTVNNESSSYDKYYSSESTEIVNNSYQNVENVSTYDDTKVIYFLDKFVAICAAIEKNTAAKANSSSNLSPSVSNHDESVTYGNTESIDNSRSYTTEYGDSISNVSTLENDYRSVDSRAYDDSVKYGDSLQTFENSLTSYGSSNKVVTAYDIENALSNSVDSVYSDVDDSVIEYGDMIRNYSDVDNYGDNVKRSNSSESTDLSRTWSSSYDTDNSRSYETKIAYGDFKSDANILSNTSENKMTAQNVQILSNVADYAINSENASQTFENSLTSYGSSNKAVTAYDVENAVSSAAESIYNDAEASTIKYGDTKRSYSNENSYEIENALNSSLSKSDSNSIENSFSNADSYKIGSSFSSADSYSIQNALDNAAENDNRVIANSSENSLSDYAGAVRYDDASYDFNYGEKTIDFSGDSYKAYSTSESNSQSIISNSNGSNSIFNSTSSNANEAIEEHSSNVQSLENAIENIDTATNVSSNSSVADNFNSSSSSFNNVENGYSRVDNDYLGNSDENTVITSIVYPALENIFKMIEGAVERNFNESSEYYKDTESAETVYIKDIVSDLIDSADFAPVDVVIEAPDLTTSENEEILTAEKAVAFIPPPEDKREPIDDRKPNDGSKHIVLEIAGSGSIDITDGVDKEQVLELLQENIKPVLMNIIAGEIYEEGDGSYDF